MSTSELYPSLSLAHQEILSRLSGIASRAIDSDDYAVPCLREGGFTPLIAGTVNAANMEIDGATIEIYMPLPVLKEHKEYNVHVTSQDLDYERLFTIAAYTANVAGGMINSTMDATDFEELKRTLDDAEFSRTEAHEATERLGKMGFLADFDESLPPNFRPDYRPPFYRRIAGSLLDYLAKTYSGYEGNVDFT